MAVRIGSAVTACVLTLLVTGCSVSPPSPSENPAAPTPSASVDQPLDSGVTDTLEAVVVTTALSIDGETVAASGYVAGVIEEGGECRFIFTSESGAVVDSEAEGLADRSTTACASGDLPYASFERGRWSVVLDYTSTDGENVRSEPIDLEIP